MDDIDRYKRRIGKLARSQFELSRQYSSLDDVLKHADYAGLLSCVRWVLRAKLPWFKRGREVEDGFKNFSFSR